jgi:hypothetical protein
MSDLQKMVFLVVLEVLVDFRVAPERQVLETPHQLLLHREILEAHQMMQELFQEMLLEVAVVPVEQVEMLLVV